MTSITPIRFTTDVRAAADFYSLLGLDERESETSRTWASLVAAGGGLGIHIADLPTRDEDSRAVSLQATVDGNGPTLDELHARLTAAGHAPGDILDETFGRYFTVA